MSRLFVVPDIGPATTERADPVAEAVRRLLRTARSGGFTAADLMQDLLQVAVHTLDIDGAVVTLPDGDDIRFGRLPEGPPSAAGPPTTATVPLHTGGRAWGRLDLHRRPGHPWTTSDLDVAMSLGGVAAAGLALAAAPGLVWSQAHGHAHRHARALGRELEQLGTHGEVTGLPNSRMVSALLERALTTAERHGRVVALLVLEVDGFDDIVDRRGQAFGDALLADAAHRLSIRLRANDSLCRLSMTEFAVICEDLTGAPTQVDQWLRILARRIQRDLRRHPRVRDSEASLSITVGGASTRHPCRPEDLISEARSAALVARTRGSGRIVISEPGIVPTSAPPPGEFRAARLFSVQGSGTRRRGRGPSRRR
jgi:diguanylate cyclase (GGDEF)-like protein